MGIVNPIIGVINDGHSMTRITAFIRGFTMTDIRWYLLTMLMVLVTTAPSSASDPLVKQFAGLDYSCPATADTVDHLHELIPDALKLEVVLAGRNGSSAFARG